MKYESVYLVFAQNISEYEEEEAFVNAVFKDKRNAERLKNQNIEEGFESWIECWLIEDTLE